jgi:hypothetical protein
MYFWHSLTWDENTVFHFTTIYMYCTNVGLNWSLMSFLSFGHCGICLSIYGFWLPLWYLQTPVLYSSFNTPLESNFSWQAWKRWCVCLHKTNWDNLQWNEYGIYLTRIKHCSCYLSPFYESIFFRTYIGFTIILMSAPIH